jgi:hypothetical protein
VDDLRDFAAQTELEVMVADVADPIVQQKAVSGIGALFHLASAHLETGLSDAAHHRINDVSVVA